MIGGKNCKGMGPRTHPLGADNVDTSAYTGQIGDLIRIEPYAVFKVDKVLVTIRAEKAGLIEHGLAKLDPTTKQWEYTATTDNPEKEDWSIAVTAVREHGHQNKFLSKERSLLRGSRS